MASVRAAVQPLSTALGSSNSIWLQGSFVGLPLINQALAALHPLPNHAFFVTVRGLMQVLATIPVNAVVNAVAASHAPPPPTRPPTNPPAPSPTPSPAPGAHPPTCGVELDLSSPGGVTARIFGGGFVASESIAIIEGGQVIATANANTLGMYSVTIGVIQTEPPTPHSVHAQGLMSGRISNNAGFTI
jgi:hypothetical protein